MSSGTQSWGCCNDEKSQDELFIKCINCSKPYNFLCLSISIISPDSEAYLNWTCPLCANRTPKARKDDSTSIRNVSVARGNKRPALNSPSPTTPSVSSGDDVRTIIRDVIKQEFSVMLKQINDNTVNVVNRELEPIKRDIREITESMTFMNMRFNDIEAEQAAAKNITKELQEQNTKMRITITELNQRLNNLEQQSRSNNVEIQCVPENKSENLYEIIMKLGTVVGCGLQDNDILPTPAIYCGSTCFTVETRSTFGCHTYIQQR